MAEGTTVGYGALDLTDPRRLSFISFADVVLGEHVEYDRQEGGMGGGLVSGSTTIPSASASPTTTTPTTTTTPELDHSLSRESTCAAGAGGLGGELVVQIETMRQALRKTRSGDLGGARSQPMSLSPVRLRHEEE